MRIWPDESKKTKLVFLALALTQSPALRLEPAARRVGNRLWFQYAIHTKYIYEGDRMADQSMIGRVREGALPIFVSAKLLTITIIYCYARPH
jgi:hypothetical protein